MGEEGTCTMLKRVRIEIEAGSPDEAVADLTKYEHAIQACEAERYGLQFTADLPFKPWATSVGQRDFYHDRLGRRITEEVIEFDPGGPSYVARRVVRFIRLDGRDVPSVVPPPRVVDHWEDRTTYPDDDTSVPPVDTRNRDVAVDEARLRRHADALVWAEEFAKVQPEVDMGLMIGWFANAMETAKASVGERAAGDPPDA